MGGKERGASHFLGIWKALLPGIAPSGLEVLAQLKFQACILTQDEVRQVAEPVIYLFPII